MRKRFKYLFRSKKPTSAELAKKRLQIIIQADKTTHGSDTVMEQFRRDLLDVISRNFKVDISELQEAVKVDMGQKDGQSTLELNITLPNQELAEEAASV